MQRKKMEELDKLVADVGYTTAVRVLSRHARRAQSEDNVLTIVVNQGVHNVPEDLICGELFHASVGNLDFSSRESVHSEFRSVLSNVARKLKSKAWKEVYILPFGPSTLSMQIKLLVYRVTRIESTDLFYMGGSEYFGLVINQREIIVDSE